MLHLWGRNIGRGETQSLLVKEISILLDKHIPSWSSCQWTCQSADLSVYSYLAWYTNKTSRLHVIWCFTFANCCQMTRKKIIFFKVQIKYNFQVVFQPTKWDGSWKPIQINIMKFHEWWWTPVDCQYGFTRTYSVWPSFGFHDIFHYLFDVSDIDFVSLFQKVSSSCRTLPLIENIM